jgi:hypothetical protein
VSFRVKENPIAPSELQPWLDGLKSADRSKRFEAARTLGSIAPPSLEETLLGFINDPEFREYTALAFHRLNTPRSMNAMAELMQGPFTLLRPRPASRTPKTGPNRKGGRVT